jgi:3-hydroxyisobutyrate dehydrogenase
MRIAFLGTGLMGSGFVRALLKRGHEVTVWNRTASRARALVSDGARLADDPAMAAAGAERLFLSLSDDASVDAALAAALSGLPAESPVIDLTTTAPAPTRARALELAAAGRGFLHAPVFMGPAQARSQEGLMLCAGPAALYTRVEPELAAMTGKLLYLGEEPGRAAAFKLFGNALFFAMVSGLADVFAVARGAGVEPAEVLELFKDVNPSGQLAYRGPKMVKGDYAPMFELQMARKDVRLMLETVPPGVPLAILPAMAARMDELIAKGRGHEDLGVLADGIVTPPA